MNALYSLSSSDPGCKMESGKGGSRDNVALDCHDGMHISGPIESGLMWTIQ